MKKLTAITAVLTLLVALFALTACAKKVTVTFDGNGGETADGKESVTMEVVLKKEFATPVFQREGYKFVGWDTDLNKLTDGCVVKAQWIQGAAVTFDTQGGEMEEQDVFFGIGENVGKLPVPEKGEISPWNNMREYRFKGWYLNGSEIREGYTWNSDKTQVTLVAKWEKAVKVVFDSDGGTDFGYTYIYKN